MINLDTGTAFVFVSEGSPVRHRLKAFVAGRPMVMTQTAFDEFIGIVNTIAGLLEQARTARFLQKVTVIADEPSARATNLITTNSVGESDKIIFGTGDKLGITTMTADAKFIRGSKAQGVDFAVYLHQSQFLIGV